MAVAERRCTVLGDRDTSRCPHTVLCQGGAACRPGARSYQVRGRGSPRPPSVTLAAGAGAGAGVPSKAQGQGTERMGAEACAAAERAAWQSAVCRRLPSGPREAAGAPPPRHPSWRHVSRANAVSRVRRADTARPHVWASRVNAFPWPWVFSTRARDVWPAGVCRRHNTAASENAHGRSACPLWRPEVPDRLPADACAQCTRRPSEPTFWTRGPCGRS
jgi:hypothetical protein